MGFVKTCRTLLSADALLSITLPLALWFVLPLTVYFWAFKCDYCGDEIFFIKHAVFEFSAGPGIIIRIAAGGGGGEHTWADGDDIVDTW